MGATRSSSARRTPSMDGVDLPAGQDQLLRKARGRVPEGRRDDDDGKPGGGQGLQLGCRLLSTARPACARKESVHGCWPRRHWLVAFFCTMVAGAQWQTAKVWKSHLSDLM